MFRRLFSTEGAVRTKQVVDGLRRTAEQVGATVAQVAIAWVLRQPGVISAIAGSGNPDRARANARAADVVLSDDDLRALDDLIPFGPAFAE
jgi:aryl-alcohol dehydrogenase-like predicted oxidoreductase